MANDKQKLGKVKQDDDLDLDFGDGGFDFDAEMKDSRTPSTQMASGFVKGLKGSIVKPELLTDRRFIGKAIEQLMPAEFGQAASATNQVIDQTRRLYDNVARDAAPAIDSLKRTTKTVLPMAGKILPPSVKNALASWSEPSAKSASVDHEQARIDSELGQVFGSMQQNQQRQEANDKKKEVGEARRHLSSLSVLGEIQRGVSTLSAYQLNVGANFQRKSLELQYRQYFVLASLLDETKKQNATTSELLNNIMKNTGLPDYDKMNSKEFIAQTMRNKFSGMVSQKIFNNNTVQGTIDKIFKAAGARISAQARDFRDTLVMGLDTANDAADAMGQMGQMGGLHELGGQMAGGAVGGTIAGKLAKKFVGAAKGHISKHEGVGKLATTIGYGLGNFNRLVNDYGNSRTKEGGLWGSLKDESKAIAKDATELRLPTIATDSINNLQEGGAFTRNTNRTITDVIPGYLARIFRELQVIRTGDDKIDLTKVDPASGRFMDGAKLKNSLIGGMFGAGAMDTLGNQGNKVLDHIDPNGELKPADREALLRYILSANKDNKLMNMGNLTDATKFTGMDDDTAGRLSTHFAGHFGNEKGHAKQRAFTAIANEYGSHLDVNLEKIQGLVNLGFGPDLIDAGILDANGNVAKEGVIDSYFNGPHKFGADLARGGTRGMPVAPANQRTKRKIKNVSAHPSLGGASTSSTGGENFTANNSADFNGLKAAIEAANVKQETVQIRDILTTIGGLLANGITVHGAVEGTATGGGSQQGTPTSRWYNQTVKQFLKNAPSNAMTGMNWLLGSGFKRLNSVKNSIQGRVTQAKDFALGGVKKITKFVMGPSDVYIPGRKRPVLLASAMEDGEYVDVNSKKPVKSISDITGEVRNKEGNVVLSAEEAEKAYTRWDGKEMALSAVAKLKKVKDTILNGIASPYAMAFRLAEATAKKAWGLGKELLRGAFDVYVQTDMSTPVLSAHLMEKGFYYSKLTGKVIKTPDDIDGPVIGADKKIALTVKQITDGIVDVDGKPVRSRVRSLVKSAFGYVLDGGKRLLGLGKRAKDYVTDKAKALAGAAGTFATDGLSGLVNKAKGINGVDVGFGSKKTLGVLEDIREILDSRLPGGGKRRKKYSRSTGGDEGGAQSTYSEMKSDAKGLYTSAKQKAQDKWEQTREGREKAIAAAKEKRDELRKIKAEDVKNGLRDKKEKIQKDALARKEAIKERAKALLDRGKETRVGKAAVRAGEAIGGVKKGIGSAIGRGAELVSDGGSMLWDGAKAAGGWLAGKMGFSTVASWLGGGALSAGASALTGGAVAAEAAAGTAAVATAAAGGVSTLGAIVGGIGGAIGSIFSAPVLLGAAAVAAIGAVGVVGYNALQNRLVGIQKLRFVQYGFLPDENQYWGIIKELETECDKGVSYDKEGKASLNDKDLKFKDIIGKKMAGTNWARPSFGIDLDKKSDVAKFLIWYSKRFKPVFLTHKTAAKKANEKATDLSIIHVSLSPKEKVEYLKMARFEDGPYDMDVSPMPDVVKLKAGPRYVESIYKEVMEEAMKDLPEDEKKDKPATTDGDKGKDKPGDKPSGDQSATGAAVAGGGLLAGAMDSIGDFFKNAAGGMGIIGIAVKGAEVARSVAVSVFGISPAMASDNDTIDAFSAVRFRAYGLTDLASTRTGVITNLEREYQKRISNITQTEVECKLDDEFITYLKSWFKGGDLMKWFIMRFERVYTTYVAAVFAATGKKDPKDAVKALTPKQQYAIAEKIIMATTKEGSPIWNVNASPWPDYPVNTNKSSVDENMNAIKAKITKEDAAREEKAAGDKRSGTPQKTIFDKASDYLGQKWQGVKDGFFSGVDKAKELANKAKDAAGSAWDTTKGAVTNAAGSVADFGKDVLNTAQTGLTKIGEGIGGLVSKLPIPTDKKSMIEMIKAAASMTGAPAGLMLTMGGAESAFNSSAKASTSTASGLFQFIKSTWNTMLKKYGPKYGLSPDTPVSDPRANALMGGEYIKENAGILKKANVDITNGNIYMAHFLGPGGAIKFIRAMQQNPNMTGVDLFADMKGSKSDPVAANRTIFLDKARSDRPRTLAEIYQIMTKKVAKADTVNGQLPSQPAPANQNNPAGTPNATTPPSTTVPTPPVGEAPSGAAAVPPGGAVGAVPPAPAATPALAGAADAGAYPAAVPPSVAADAKKFNDGSGLAGINDLMGKSVAIQGDMAKTLVAILLQLQNGGSISVTTPGKQQDVSAPISGPQPKNIQRQAGAQPLPNLPVGLDKKYG